MVNPTPSETGPQTFHITGMHCGSCVARIQNGLKQAFPQLESISVNLASEQAYIQGSVSPESVIATIRQLGYHAELMEPIQVTNQATSKAAEDERKQARKRLTLAISLTVPVFLMHMTGWHFTGSGWIQFLLSTPVLFYCGKGIFSGAWASAKRASSDMDTLIALGAGIAWLYSTALLILKPMASHTALYFETGAMIVTLILLGRYLETRARGQAGEAIRALMQLQPETALLQRNGQLVEVPVSEVTPGDVAMVRPGSRIPLDGLVLEGEAAVNEAMMTGESIPVEKRPGDTVLGGTMNENGSLIIRISHVGSETALNRIIELVTKAQSGKPPAQELADKVAGIFVPIVLLVALATLTGWLLTGHTLAQAVSPTIAVLVISCPCALGLATPTAIQVGLGRGAQLGILIRDTAGLDKAHKLDAMVIDKTGTLTQGQPKVIRFEQNTNIPQATCLGWITALEEKSEHPLSKALVAFAREQGIESDWQETTVEHFKSYTGRGIAGTIDGNRILIGNPAFLTEQGIDLSSLEPELAHHSLQGETTVVFALNSQPSGLFRILDPLREDSAKAIRQLRLLGIQPVMLTGDSRATALNIGHQAGLLAEEVIAEVSPEEKQDIVRRLQIGTPELPTQQPARKRIGMVGDGINDAPALALADVSIAMGTGTDIAMQTAQMTLVQGDLSKAVAAVRLSRAISRTIRQNLFWAFFYNVIAIPIAALGFLSPIIAAGAMSFSSVTVVMNSLRLRHSRK